MDLGGANLHTSLGVDAPVRTLSDLLLGRVDDIHELVQSTSMRNLFLISGAQDPVGIANMRHMQKTRLIRKFREINADFILLDLGRGHRYKYIRFFSFWPTIKLWWSRPNPPASKMPTDLLSRRFTEC